MGWEATAQARTWVIDRPGFCLRYAQSFFGAPARHRSAWHAWQATVHKHAPSEALPPVPVLLWFEHWGDYNDGLGRYGNDPNRPYYGNWGHVAAHVPGDAIYTSPSTPVGSPPGRERYATIQQIEARFNAKYVGWSEDINGLRFAEYDGTVPPAITDLGDDMTKPMLAMKLDGGPMNTLGVMIDPDGSVTGLNPDQWAFWEKTAKVEPVLCKNPGHWEYLMGVMAKRRARNNVTVSTADMEKITGTIREAVKGAQVTAESVASALQITVKK